jgi:hypothetical protein
MLLQLGLCYYSWNYAITAWAMLLQLGLCYYSLVYTLDGKYGGADNNSIAQAVSNIIDQAAIA